MTDQPDHDAKVAKKVAKAAAKVAKKEAAARPPASSVGDGTLPAERAAAAAERQVALQRWRVGLAAVAALIALATLLAMWSRSS